MADETTRVATNIARKWWDTARAIERERGTAVLLFALAFDELAPEKQQLLVDTVKELDHRQFFLPQRAAY